MPTDNQVCKNLLRYFLDSVYDYFEPPTPNIESYKNTGNLIQAICIAIQLPHNKALKKPYKIYMALTFRSTFSQKKRPN